MKRIKTKATKPRLVHQINFLIQSSIEQAILSTKFRNKYPKDSNGWHMHNDSRQIHLYYAKFLALSLR